MKHLKILLVLLLATFGSTPLYARLQGQALIDSLLKELPRQKEDTNKVKLLRELSYGYNSISPDEGIKYAQQLLALATKLGYKTGVASAYNNLGVIYKTKSDFSKALEYDLKTLKLDEEIHNKQGIAAATANIGSVYIGLCDYPKALEYYFKALKLDEEGGYKLYTALVTGNIGSVYEIQHDYPKALEYYFKALKLDEALGDLNNVALSLSSIGNVYIQQGAYPKALEYNFKALKLFEELGNQVDIEQAINYIGMCYEGLLDYPGALKYYFGALNLSEKLDSKEDIAYNELSIAGAYVSIVKDTSAKARSVTVPAKLPGSKYVHDVPVPKGKAALLAGAIDYMQRALAVGKEISNNSSILECYLRLSGVYELKGDYKKALEYQAMYYAINDSVYSNDNKVKIAKLATQRESDLKEKQIAINKLEVAGKRNERIIFGVVFGVMLLSVSFLFLYLNFVRKSRREIQKERDTSDNLLLNILPAEVAEELKAKGSAEAKLINEVTVMFTDIKGFTTISEKLTPKELVAEINTCFSAFDLIMQKYGVEKIKTIGDAYMAAGGLPTPNTTNAVDVVKAALDIQDFMRRHKAEHEAAGKLFFEIRIGIHTGPVVAGIVGIKKFAYDIWGDTVNTANRMETSGEVGKVNISETTYELVKEIFTCEYRGEVEAKGKGVMKMYFVS